MVRDMHINVANGLVVFVEQNNDCYLIRKQTLKWVRRC